VALTDPQTQIDTIETNAQKWYDLLKDYVDFDGNVAVPIDVNKDLTALVILTLPETVLGMSKMFSKLVWAIGGAMRKIGRQMLAVKGSKLMISRLPT
jgi:hypothetical protein